jgi:hypothetical protein
MVRRAKFLADLHIHSHLSRATSKDLTLEHLHGWAQRKGIKVVGTGDFTHPAWFAELREKLVPAEPGLFALRGDRMASAPSPLLDGLSEQWFSRSALPARRRRAVQLELL